MRCPYREAGLGRREVRIDHIGPRHEALSPARG